MTAIEPIHAIEAAEPSTLVELRRIIAAVDTERATLVEAGDLNRLAYGLGQMRTLLSDLRILAGAIEDDVARMMPAKTVDIDGLGRIERRRGTDRRAWH